MSAITLDIQRMDIFREVLEVEDSKLLDNIMSYVQKIKKAVLPAVEFPCTMTLTELKTEIMQAEKDYAKGKSFSTEEVFKEYENGRKMVATGKKKN